MLKQVSVLLVGLLSVGNVFAKMAEETVIPGYSPPVITIHPAETTTQGASSPKSISTPASISASDKITSQNQAEQSQPSLPSVVKAPAGLLANPKTLAAWQEYLNKVRNCMSSTHILPQINPVIAKQYGDIETDKIIGVENGKCHLTIMYYGDNDPRLVKLASPEEKPPLQYPAGQECLLTEATVNSMIAFNIEILKGKEVKISSDDPLSKAIAQDCTPFVVINGQKVMTS